MHFIPSRDSRRSLESRVRDTVKDVLGGRDLTMTGSSKGLEDSLPNDQPGFPLTQNAQFKVYSVCGIYVCGDDSVTGP